MAMVASVTIDGGVGVPVAYRWRTGGGDVPLARLYKGHIRRGEFLSYNYIPRNIFHTKQIGVYHWGYTKWEI